MKSPRVLGLDLSLTATGVAFPDGTTATWSQPLTGVARLAWFRQALTALLAGVGPYGHDLAADLVVIEGHAFNTKYGQPHALGELAGVVKLVLHDLDVTWLEIPPASLKRYATGKGNASKEAVLVAAVLRLGYEGHSNDESDALWLRQMALDHYGWSTTSNGRAMPQTHRDALAKITWPELAA